MWPSVICERWQIAAVPFPFMERPASKRRPALALSRSSFNRENGHTVFAMITTANGESWPSDYAISQIVQAGLTHDCYLRWKLFTLPNSYIIRLIGHLAKKDQDALALRWKGVFSD